MQPSQLVCSRCGRTATPGTLYCANCGEAVDPALVAELRNLYTVLMTLSAEVDAGRGDVSVAYLRDEFRVRYLRLRAAPGATPAGADAPVTPAPVTPAMPVAPGAPSVPPAPISAAVNPPDWLLYGLAAPPARVRPPRPAFSWWAFLSEQAIAIMAYLGAFLLLVATLAFELGGWQALSDGVKLAVVLVVYVAFGALGIGLRRVRDLRTVSSAYLGIFALMTPLVALAVYRFALQSSGFPVAGMICIGAAYAAIVYLALALRTDFAVYAYLGWLSLGVAVLEALMWGNVSTNLSMYFLALFALALLFPAGVSRWQVAARLGAPARQVAVLASAIPLLVVALSALGQVILTLADRDVRHDNALLLASCALVALGVGWSATLRAWQPRLPWLAATSDIAVAVLATQSAILLAVRLGVAREGLPGVAGLLALAALAAAIWYRRATPAVGTQRYGLEVIALLLVGSGYLMPHLASGSDWPLIAVLSAGILVAAGVALLENAPWWLLLAGFFLTVDYQAIGRAVLPASHLNEDSSPLYAALTFAVWALALGLSRRERSRRYALPVFVVALGDALFTTLLLRLNPSADTRTIILLAFLALAFVATWLERQPVLGGVVVGFFGALTSVPWGQVDGPANLKGAALALALGLAALVVRRALGRPLALPLYVAGLWSVALAVSEARAADAVSAGWVVAGAPFATWL
ncbi:MAG TPA: hypothetical protein VGR57_13065, partial [Ktedonobacterales bacterium]|nr:hypothetical protein [Ktedonobacterales bacterium]